MGSVQPGLGHLLRLVKTRTKGWCVQTMVAIPKGTYVCDYVGELVSSDFVRCEESTNGTHRTTFVVSMDKYGSKHKFGIDGHSKSNVARFFNHCCDPNCFKQRVFCDHGSRLPRIAFYAMRDIQPYEELCYDYGYADVPGKTMPCMCGQKGCKKLLY